MADLAAFRAAVRERRRSAGRTQQQLARAVGLHPNVLSHKLHASDGTRLTAADVVAIATTLAGWGSLRTPAAVHDLLDLMDVPPHAVPAAAWARAPLSALPGADAESGAAAPGLPDVGPERPAPAGLPPGAAPLPHPTTELIGRSPELSAGAEALKTARLLTLTGPGGIGKTRLAVELAGRLAARFPDGVVYADLAAVPASAQLAPHLLHALGLQGGVDPGPEEQLLRALRRARSLLVVDNLEHLVHEATLLPRILAAAPHVRILASSRVALRLSGEVELRVPPLRLDSASGDGSSRTSEPRDSEAVRLFLQRAGALGIPADHTEADLEVVAAVCEQLDGLPLAIELAASRTRSLTPADLHRRLTGRLSLLTRGARDLPPRQQTLRATLDWSFDLLSPAARELLACVSVFAGPFDLPAAVAVADRDEAGVLDGLSELVEHSMLDVAASAPRRFRTLRTVREYGLDRLTASGREADVRDRHLDHLLRLGRDVERYADGPDQLRWLDRLDEAGLDVRAALEWCERTASEDCSRLDAGLRLATSTAYLWRRRGSLDEGAEYLDRMLTLADRSRTVPDRTLAEALIEAGLLACLRGRYSRATELAKAGCALAGPLGDQILVTRGWRVRALSAVEAGSPDAEELCRRHVEEAERSGSVGRRATAYNLVGWWLGSQGRTTEATRALRRGLACARQHGNPEEIGDMLVALGSVARTAGDLSRSVRLCRRGLRLLASLDFSRTTASGLEELAASTAMAGDGHRALVYLGAATELRARMGAPASAGDAARRAAVLDTACAGLSARERDAAVALGQGSTVAELLELPDAGNAAHNPQQDLAG